MQDLSPEKAVPIQAFHPQADLHDPCVHVSKPGAEVVPEDDAARPALFESLLRIAIHEVRIVAPVDEGHVNRTEIRLPPEGVREDLPDIAESLFPLVAADPLPGKGAWD